MRQALRCVGCFALVLGLVILTGVSAEAGAKKTLKLGTVLPPDNVITLNATEFAKRVNERAKGELEVVVYPNTQLGNERDMAEGMQLGTVEMAAISTGILTNFVPEVGVTGLPFIFRSWDHLEKVLRSPLADQLSDMILKRTGIRTLGWWEQGFRVTITTRKPINSLQDLQGLKIRLPEEKVLIRTFQLMKAAPTVVPWGEVYTSLQTGVVEGMESSPPGIFTMKFYEVAPYLAETNHQHAVVQLLVSDKVFQSLSKDVQDVIRQAAKEATDINYRTARTASTASWDQLKAKAKQTTFPELGPFREAVQPLFKEFGEQTKTHELIRQIQAVQ